MSTLLQLQLPKKTHRLLPIWILRLVGFSSVTIALVNIVFRFCRRLPPPSCQFNKNATTTISSFPENTLRRTSTGLKKDTTSPSSPPYAYPPSTDKWWVLQILDYVMVATLVFKKKKKLTISLKNTILWNPSQDIAMANHAFNEDAVPLLSRLCQQYEVYLLIHINNDQEYDQIQRLLSSSIIIGSSTTTTPASLSLLDKSRIIYCKNEVDKVRMVKYVLCPAIHVEGGCELNDGEDVIRGLQSAVDKIVWVMTRRRRASFNKENVKLKDQDILVDGLELADSLLDSSLAREAGFFID